MPERSPLGIKYFPCDTVDKAAQITFSCWLLSHPARFGLNDITTYQWRVIPHPDNNSALIELDLDAQILFHNRADIAVPIRALLGEPSAEDLIKYRSFLAAAQLEEAGIMVYVSDLIPTPALSYLLSAEDAVAYGFIV